MDKVALRKIYQERRNTFSHRELLINDDLLLLKFQQLDFSGVNTLMSYWPIEKNNEPNTHLFSDYLHFLLPQLKTIFPVITDSQNMEGVLVDENTIYDTNSWGITEPINGQPVDPQSIDLILVPLLIFDKLGYRVGYGKGFYDRFLAKCNKDAILVGFSYFDPIEKITDTNEFDIPLTFGITPHYIYEF